MISIFAAILVGSVSIGSSESGIDDTRTAEQEPNDGESDHKEAIEIDGSAGTDILDFAGETVLGDNIGGQVSGSDGDDILTGVSAAEDQASGITQLVGNRAHVLEGGAGNDLIMIGANDLAYGGSGEDTFLLDGDLGDEAVPEIGDFHSDEDVIIVSLPSDDEILSEAWPNRPEFHGTVQISSPTSTGLYGIHIDGNHIANVRSEEEIYAEDIVVLYDTFVGPSQFDIEFGYA